MAELPIWPGSASSSASEFTGAWGGDGLLRSPSSARGAKGEGTKKDLDPLNASNDDGGSEVFLDVLEDCDDESDGGSSQGKGNRRNAAARAVVANNHGSAEKAAVKEEGGDDGNAREIDAAMIKEEVKDVLDAIDYHQGTLWPEEGKAVLQAIAKAREEDAAAGGRGRVPVITQDLKMVLASARARGINLRKWFTHYDPKRSGRVTTEDLRRALAGLGLAISVGSSEGGVEYGGALPGASVGEEVIERVLNPIAITELIGRLDDGGQGAPYELLIKCAELSPNRFDRLLPKSGKKKLKATRAAPLPFATRKKADRGGRHPATPSQAQAQARARLRSRIRTSSQKKKAVELAAKKGKPGLGRTQKAKPRRGGARAKQARPSRGEKVAKPSKSPVPGETGLNVQVAIQTMQRITNKRIAQREAREMAALVALTEDEKCFEDRLIKLIQASGPFYALMKDIETTERAGIKVARKYVTAASFTKILRKLFAIRIRADDAEEILGRAASLIADEAGAGEGAGKDEAAELQAALSPRDKRALGETNGTAVSTKRMNRYLRRIRCRKRMGFGDWFGQKQEMSAEISRANQATVQSAAEGKKGALERIAAAASVLEVDALMLLGKSSAPRVASTAVNNELSVPDLQAALDELQTTLLSPGTLEGEALAVANDWTETHDGRMKVLVLAREEAGIGPRFGKQHSPSPKKKKKKKGGATSRAVEEYPEPPPSTIHAATQTLKTERFAELMGDDRFKKAIFRKLFGEYCRAQARGHGAGDFKGFQAARIKRQQDAEASILGWQKKKAREEDKKRTAEAKFAGVNELIEFVESLTQQTTREFSNMAAKFATLRELGAKRVAETARAAERAASQNKHAFYNQTASSFGSSTCSGVSTGSSPSSADLAKHVYANAPSAKPKVGTVSMKEFVDLMGSVFFSLQADPKTSVVANVVLDGLKATIGRSYEALVKTENGAKKLAELGESALRRMQDQLVRGNRLVQTYLDLFSDGGKGQEEARSNTLHRLNQKEEEARRKYGEWLKKKKSSEMAKEALAKKKVQIEKAAAKKNKEKSSITVESWTKKLKSRKKIAKKRVRSKKAQQLKARPAWVDVAPPPEPVKNPKGKRKGKKTRGLL
jgi:hypothetical protein